MKTDKRLDFLYNTVVGRCLLKIVSSHVFAGICSIFLNSRFSKYKIKKFIKDNNIPMSDYEIVDYNSFNHFFTRNIKAGKRKICDGLIAVCDGMLSVYEISEDLTLNIKNSVYTVDELINEKGKKYNYVLIFRLDVKDYHHYVFPDNGVVINSKFIKGVLHTVQPISFKRNKVYSENSRNITFLDCENLGNVCYIEVGAMLIGKIVNEKIKVFKKGNEKGHFEFGGSTVVLLLENDKVRLREDILKIQNSGLELPVKLGERIGFFD